MAFTESLRLILTADTRGAVQGIEKVGRTADRELGRTDKSLDRLGLGLTRAGAGMLAVGAAGLAGLGAMAMASEDARLSVVKLENTIANMPKLAGATSGEFIDLADSIQQVTAADADAIVEGEALLGTFNLTAQEIKGITPLVVDYARKFGVDIPDAAVQVGKALDGQVGALKRNGVSIDEVLFKTDRYRAVSEALSDQVGGFAEAEGKMFAGSLARLKNQLGDLAEGVGAGAVDALSGLADMAAGLTDRFQELDPATQSLIGKTATYGSLALLAAGGLSVTAGAAIQARTNLVAMASGVSTLISGLGGLKTAAIATAGVLAGVVASVELAKLDDAASRARAEKVFGMDRLVASLREGGAEAERHVERFVVLANRLGFLEEAVRRVADVNPALSRELIRAAEAAGIEDDKISGLRDVLSNHQSAAAAATEGQAGLAGAMGETAGATEDATSALEDYANALAAQFDPLFGMQDALHGAEGAQRAVAEAQAALNEAMAAGDPTAIAEAQRGYDDALDGAKGALFDVQQAQLTLNDAILKGEVSVADAQRQLYDWAVAAGYTHDQAMVMAGGLGTAADAAAWLGAQDPVVSVATQGVPQANQDLIGLKSRLDAIPREVNIVTRVSTILAGSTNIPRQHGGPVEAGRAYIVGEKRPELFVPDENGMIWPSVPPVTGPVGAGLSAPGGGGAGSVINLNITGSGRLAREFAYAVRSGEIQAEVDGKALRIRT